MHITTHSILVVLLCVVIGADAFKIYRVGNAKGPLTGTKLSDKDFNIKDGNVLPGTDKGLSTYKSVKDIEAAFSKTNMKNIFSIESDAVVKAGFDLREDGLDVGGKLPNGHCTIFVKKKVDETTLFNGLNGKGEPGEGVLQWTKLDNPKKEKGTTAVKPKPAPTSKGDNPKAAAHGAHPAANKPGTLHIHAPTSKGKNHPPRHMSRVFRGVEVAA